MNGSSCCKRSKFMPKNPKGSRFWIFGRWTSVLLYYMVKSGKTLKDEPWQQAREHELWNRVDFLASFHVHKNTLQMICESLVVSTLSWALEYPSLLAVKKAHQDQGSLVGAEPDSLEKGVEGRTEKSWNASLQQQSPSSFLPEDPTVVMTLFSIKYHICISLRRGG